MSGPPTPTETETVSLEKISANANKSVGPVVNKSVSPVNTSSGVDTTTTPTKLNPYKIPAETRTINNAKINCKGVVIGPNGFVSIQSIDSIDDLDNKTNILNKDENGDPSNTPLTLDTLKEQLNLTVTTKKAGGSKRSRKAKRTKKGGKKRRNTQRRQRKSR